MEAANKLNDKVLNDFSSRFISSIGCEGTQNGLPISEAMQIYEFVNNQIIMNEGIFSKDWPGEKHTQFMRELECQDALELLQKLDQNKVNIYKDEMGCWRVKIRKTEANAHVLDHIDSAIQRKNCGIKKGHSGNIIPLKYPNVYRAFERREINLNQAIDIINEQNGLQQHLKPQPNFRICIFHFQYLLRPRQTMNIILNSNSNVQCALPLNKARLWQKRWWPFGVALRLQWKHCSKEDETQVIVQMAKIIRMGYSTSKLALVFKLVVAKHYYIKRTKPDDMDIDTIICCISVANKDENLKKFIDKCLQKFPNDSFLLEMRVMCFLHLDQPNEAINLIDAALKKNPNNIRLLFVRANAYSQDDDKFVNKAKMALFIKAVDDFLRVAPKDHPKVPFVYYQKAMAYINSKSPELAKYIQYFEQGLAAEKLQLPCFLPYNFPPKSHIERMYNKLKSMGY